MSVTKPSNSAAIYMRVACLGPGNPVEEQRKLLRREAEAEGLVVDAEYIDAGCSGSSTKTCPQLRNLLADAKAGLFKHLLVRDFSRLSRGPELATVVGELRRYGVVLHCATERMVLA